MMKTEILYGLNPVMEALRAGRRKFEEIWILEKETRRLFQVLAMAEEKNISVRRVQSGEFQILAGIGLHQGVAAKTGSYPTVDLDGVLNTCGSGPGFLLLLDHILDPQNLGAIVRTALCAGVDAVIIPKDRSAGPTPAVSRASAGALEHLRLCRATNLTAVIKKIKERGMWIIGLDKTAERSIFETDLTVPSAIVIGGEHQGIGALVKKNCDLLAAIPQTCRFNSLNASAAGAVAIYEAFRQRSGTGTSSPCVPSS
jgi:23S rRNA (guanosine2251-2'-O)-methyltransferase